MEDKCCECINNPSEGVQLAKREVVVIFQLPISIPSHAELLHCTVQACRVPLGTLTACAMLVVNGQGVSLTSG